MSPPFVLNDQTAPLLDLTECNAEGVHLLMMIMKYQVSLLERSEAPMVSFESLGFMEGPL